MPARIIALDLAASTGVAYGQVGGKPRFETWVLKGARGNRGLTLLGRLNRLLKSFTPDVVYLEEPLGANILNKIGASLDTSISLQGYVFLAEVACAAQGIPTKLASAQAVRKHFLGRPRFKNRGEGKKLAMRRCELLGWNPEGFDEADAGALFDYACAHENQKVWALREAKSFALC